MTLDPKHEDTPASETTGAFGKETDLKLSPIASDPIQEEALAKKIELLNSLDELTSVTSYLRRVGACSVNFKTAKVEEIVNGYPKRIGTIRFGSDGTVVTKGEVAPPSDAEAEAIKRAFVGRTFPQITSLVAIGDPPPNVDLDDANTFVFTDFEGRIVMVQTRYNNRDGSKGFQSYTRWTDGVWRAMEPDNLPFFGLSGWQEHSTLFIHEGAGKAARLKRLVEGREPADKFPWLEEMRHGHHVAWIGGVFAIERSDWPTLANKPWKRIVVIADNDAIGIEAAAKVAKEFSGNVSIVTFDQRFPIGCDCADEWPETLFDEGGHYTGPTMDDCLRPAMQATREADREEGQRGRSPSFIVREFAERVGFTVIPPTFFFRDRPSRTYTADEFNALTAPFSHAPKSTASKLLTQITCQHERLQYDCAHEPGPLVVDGRRDWNVFQPTRVKPAQGSAAPWEQFLSHLFPIEAERDEVKKWLATLIAMPAVRMRYGLLLISEKQGVGKNTLEHVLNPLIGRENVSYPTEQDITDSQFNDWLARKRLIFVAEIYSGASRAAYDKMKSVITDDAARINEKNVKPYTLANWATVIACSNSMAALHLDSTDRRWFVPVVTEREQPAEYWNDLYGWLHGSGFGIVLRWAQEYVSGGNHVRTGDRAPSSARKEIIVEASRSEGQALAHGLAEHMRDWPAPVILRISDVRRWIAVQRGFVRAGEPDLSERRLEKPATIIAAMKSVPGVTVWADKLRPKFGATREAVIMNFQPEGGAGWPDLKERLTTIEGINADEPL